MAPLQDHLGLQIFTSLFCEGVQHSRGTPNVPPTSCTVCMGGLGLEPICFLILLLSLFCQLFFSVSFSCLVSSMKGNEITMSYSLKFLKLGNIKKRLQISTIINKKMSSFKSSENIQKEEGGPD